MTSDPASDRVIVARNDDRREEPHRVGVFVPMMFFLRCIFRELSDRRRFEANHPRRTLSIDRGENPIIDVSVWRPSNCDLSTDGVPTCRVNLATSSHVSWNRSAKRGSASIRRCDGPSHRKRVSDSNCLIRPRTMATLSRWVNLRCARVSASCGVRLRGVCGVGGECIDSITVVRSSVDVRPRHVLATSVACGTNPNAT